MRRLIRLGDWTQVDARPDCAVVTPNENAAITLGAPHTSLEHLARSILDEERIAHPLIVQRFLRKAVEEVLDSTDPQGVARTLLPPIRELFRDSAELGSDPGSERARRVFRVAQAYHSRLRTQGLVDPAEALWEAATVPPPRQPVLVWGYPRLGRDEVAFVDAIAADDSVVYLPYADDHLFGENVATAEALQQRAWTVDRDPAPKVWEVRAHVEADEYAHFEAEVRGNLTQIKALLVDGVPADDIVLVARDDAFYGPTVLSVAREYGVPVQALYQVPLSDTRVGFWVNLLLEAMAENFPFETTARMLVHPLGPACWTSSGPGLVRSVRERPRPGRR